MTHPPSGKHVTNQPFHQSENIQSFPRHPLNELRYYSFQTNPAPKIEEVMHSLSKSAIDQAKAHEQAIKDKRDDGEDEEDTEGARPMRDTGREGSTEGEDGERGRGRPDGGPRMPAMAGGGGERQFAAGKRQTKP
ncbi:hypothetical protein Nepgr_031723 [Nepenthes gracilis]|uniref:Uncharacterized protein n=1 Tax=Nepenthes gracilis TaxID=150966 RepID=A0AAD3Y740_NEPGR|nr:hypothetical protein Nepgr_031723 [Nepenthes gracilis]